MKTPIFIMLVYNMLNVSTFFYYLFLGHNYFNMINLELSIQLRFSVFEVLKLWRFHNDLYGLTTPIFLVQMSLSLCRFL